MKKYKRHWGYGISFLDGDPAWNIDGLVAEDSSCLRDVCRDVNNSLGINEQSVRVVKLFYETKKRRTKK